MFLSHSSMLWIYIPFDATQFVSNERQYVTLSLCLAFAWFLTLIREHNSICLPTGIGLGNIHSGILDGDNSY